MSNKFKILRRRLEKELFSPDVEMIMEWVEELFEEQKEKLDYVKYLDRLFDKQYDDKVFVDYPVSPHIRINIDKFIKKQKLNEQEYKKYLKWILEMVPNIKNRIVSVYDMYDEKLWNRYIKQSPEDKEYINEKKRISNKRILTV